jgi:acyl-CoA synthetase (AMP-forming)/AMP-acid ligase II
MVATRLQASAPVGEAAEPGVESLLRTAASQHAGQPFLVWDDGSLSFRAAQRAVRGLADWLRREGVAAGDRVAVVAGNRVEAVLVALAAAEIGAPFAILHPQTSRRNLERILDDLDPALLVVEQGTAAEWAGKTVVLPEEPEPGWHTREAAALGPAPHAAPLAPADERVALVYTTGSTGRPRGVVVSHRNVLFTTAAIQRRVAYRAGDVVGLFVPLSFDYGLYQIFLALRAGASVLLDRRGVATRGADALVRHGVTVLPAVPTQLRTLVSLLRRRPRRFPALRAITTTGEALPETTRTALGALLPRTALYPMYGLTECKRVSILLPHEQAAHPGSVGRPLDGTEVFTTADGKRLPRGTVGEIVVRGENVTLGYWRDSAATSEAFRHSDDGVPELRTGDLGAIDGDGFLRVVGRRDSLVKRNGFRISLVEIEEAALAEASVRDAAAVLEAASARLHLFVAPAVPGAASRLRGRLADDLEPHKLPSEIHVLRALPRTANGKIDRRALTAALHRHDA